ncbi:MAG: hypothetical protein DRN99_01775 [Thermoproteota archaeon]|nr:MAG: hypothetical protein DRN99_01775 [Candidatus Korarchaeota archaeon]
MLRAADEKLLNLMKKVFVESEAEGPPVSFACGRLLYTLAHLASRSSASPAILEVGDGYGFSTLWLAPALADEGVDGNVYSMEAGERSREGA